MEDGGDVGRGHGKAGAQQEAVTGMQRGTSRIISPSLYLAENRFGQISGPFSSWCGQRTALNFSYRGDRVTWLGLWG